VFKNQFWGEGEGVAHCKAVSCVKNGWTDREVWDVDAGGSKEALLDWNDHWRHLAYKTEPSTYGGDATFLSNSFDHLLLLLSFCRGQNVHIHCGKCQCVKDYSSSALLPVIINASKIVQIKSNQIYLQTQNNKEKKQTKTRSKPDENTNYKLRVPAGPKGRQTALTRAPTRKKWNKQDSINHL